MTTPEIVLAGSLPLVGVNGSTFVNPRSVVTGGIAVETFFFGAQIPANAQIERQVFQVTLWGISSSNGTLALRIRAGSATASLATDTNVLHTLTTGVLATNMWVRYQALVTVTALAFPNFTVTGMAEARTGPTGVVGPANAAEKMMSLPQSTPWYISTSGQISAGQFQIKHAAITAI